MASRSDGDDTVAEDGLRTAADIQGPVRHAEHKQPALIPNEARCGANVGDLQLAGSAADVVVGLSVVMTGLPGRACFTTAERQCRTPPTDSKTREFWEQVWPRLVAETRLARKVRRAKAGLPIRLDGWC